MITPSNLYNKHGVFGMIFKGTSAQLALVPSARWTLTEGDQWYDTTNNTLKIYNGSAWVQQPTVMSAVTAEHGPGAIGTGVAPATYRRIDNGTIITEIKVDLTGLSITGTAQGAAIGLAATDGCYIGRNVVATNGIIYKAEMICLETPAKGTGTAIELDIDLCYTTAADVRSGEDVDVDVITAAHDWAAGQVTQTLLPGALTEGDYFYLAGGDTAGNACAYAAGQFIIRLHGHAALV